MAVIILLLLLLWWLFLPVNKDQGTVTEPQIRAAVATTIKQNLLVKSGARTDFEPILTSMDVYQGDTLMTEETGRGVVESNNGTVTVLDYTSQMTIKDEDTSGMHTSNYLSFGNIWARVQKVFDKGEFYEIETQNAVAVVRGTSFGVYILINGTKLVVKEGAVGFIPVDVKTRQRHYELEQIIPSGSKGTIGTDGKIVVSKLTKTDLNDPWFIFNNPDLASTTVPVKKTTVPASNTKSVIPSSPSNTGYPSSGTVSTTPPRTAPLNDTYNKPSSNLDGGSPITSEKEKPAVNSVNSELSPNNAVPASYQLQTETFQTKTATEAPPTASPDKNSTTSFPSPLYVAPSILQATPLYKSTDLILIK